MSFRPRDVPGQRGLHTPLAERALDASHGQPCKPLVKELELENIPRLSNGTCTTVVTSCPLPNCQSPNNLGLGTMVVCAACATTYHDPCGDVDGTHHGLSRSRSSTPYATVCMTLVILRVCHDLWAPIAAWGVCSSTCHVLGI